MIFYAKKPYQFTTIYHFNIFYNSLWIGSSKKFFNDFIYLDKFARRRNTTIIV